MCAAVEGQAVPPFKNMINDLSTSVEQCLVKYLRFDKKNQVFYETPLHIRNHYLLSLQ